MINLMRAEWKKSLGNYQLTSFLVWVYPVGSGAFYVLMIIASLLSETMRAGMPLGTGSWVVDMVSGWGLINSLGGGVFGRLFPLAYMAVVFAGEYEWGTWKNILPRNRRHKIISAKLIILSVLVMISLTMMTVLIAIGQGLLHRIVGIAYGPGMNQDAIAEFLSGYGREASLAGTSMLILATFAALAAVITRSTIGTLLLSFGFSILDILMAGILLLISNILNQPNLVNLFQYSITYNLDNIRTWVMINEPLRQPVPGFTAEPTFAASAVVLTGWLILLLVVTLFTFQRQDITG